MLSSTRYSSPCIVITLLEDLLRNSLVVTSLVICQYNNDNRFTADLPIDIVYTWVNGSDPILLDQLEELKRQEKGLK